MYYLGVDLGGTNIKAALVDADGAIIKEASTPTKLPRPAEAVCDDIAALCNQLAQGQQVAGIGVGCPGTVDGGLVRYSNNLDWHDFAMGDYLRAKTGLPVALANDANAAALGEALAGCAKGAESAVIITLGTGVGGGVVLGGKLLTGYTGCGKSTLLNLIPRFYDVTSGKVTVDGIDVRDMPQETLHSLLGYVPQKGILFSGSIASNLKFGGEQITDADMKKAAAIAQATEFIDAKPEGYDSPIAQGGSNVSGGQKQRLSIARAIAKAPRIYLFDDSFSALDYKTDVTLRRALKAETGDATVIIVAQRISTVLHANQILVLDEGRLVGRGTHAQLMASCPEYQEIARSQLSQKELDLKDLNTGKEEK